MPISSDGFGFATAKYAGAVMRPCAMSAGWWMPAPRLGIEVKAFVPVGQIQSDKTKGRRRRDGEPPAFFDLFGN
jgi:hypothetical protein